MPVIMWRKGKNMRRSSEKTDEIRKRLLALAEPEYQVFSASLLPGTGNILGVRLPKLRKLAKQLAAEDWKGCADSLAQKKEEAFFEEIMLKGFVIGYAHSLGKAELSEILSETEAFLPLIDNWSVCDSFCSTLKIAKEYPQEIWKFIQPYFQSEREFSVRFAAVMSLDYFIDEKYIEKLYSAYDSVRHPGYYAKMAVAWAVSMCYVRFPRKTEAYLAACALDDFTCNRAIQKTIESRCVDAQRKEHLRSLKR